MGSFKDLTVYKKSFSLALKIFKVSKKFPPEEKYSLTDQIRRSSRSVCACVAEAYRKRIYPAHFVSKTSDADMENTETMVWLDFALECGYLSKQEYEELTMAAFEVGKMLGHMIDNPHKYSSKK
jgi:four helix bundle protein